MSTPPTAGAMISTVTPSASAAARSAARVSASAPLVTRTPSLRPAKSPAVRPPVAAEDAQRRGRAGHARLAGGRGRRGQLAQAETLGDRGGELLVHVSQPGHHPGPDLVPFALAQLEDESVGDVPALDVGLADVELAGLAVVVGEALRSQPALGPAISSGKLR